MFGYFNPRNCRHFLDIRTRFIKFYCSTCKSLQYNYGQASTALLSYDIALFAMFLNINTESIKIPRIACRPFCGSFENVKNNKEWKTIAALNLMSFAEKLNDNIRDDNSFIAKALLKIYAKPLEMAKRDFPTMAQEIRNGYICIVELENQNADCVSIARLFADTVLKSISAYLETTEQQKKFLYAISSWVYIIDALDDYDKDVKKGRFNPFIKEGQSFKTFYNSNREYIINTLNTSMGDSLTYDDDSFDYFAAEILLNHFIPDVTQKIVTGSSLSTIRLRNMWHFCPLCPLKKEHTNV